jgi:hypothetical protein
MPSLEDSSISRVVLWMHVRPPDQTKQCNGTCGLSKPQSNHADRQWRKKEKGERICLNCSCSACPPPPPPAGRANKAMRWPMRPVEARRGVQDRAMEEAGQGGGEEKKGGAHLP